MQNVNFKSGGNSINAHNTTLDYINAGFRLCPGLGFSFGFIPFSSIGYDFSESKYLGDHFNSGSTMTYTNSYTGDGGLHEVYVGLGWNPFADFSVGANFGYVWGNYAQNITQTFYEDGTATSASNGLRRQIEADLSSYKIDIGVQYPIKIGKNDVLTPGITYGIGHAINSPAHYYSYVANGDTTKSVIEKAFELPTSFGAGLACDILDPALLRPGRFDRQIVVGYPDVKGREEILKVHTRNKPLGPDVDLNVIAKTTIGFTGADLENLVNEAALLAARKGRKAITMVDIEAATIKVVAGPEKRSHVVPDKDKRLTCFHEAGHAVATYYCETQDKVHEISIIPRGMAGGYTMSLPTEDRSYETKKGMQENIVTLLGGRIAEKLVLDDISTGASNDLERATKIAKAMVTRYGFSDRLGPIVYGQNENEVFLGRDFGHTRDYSETVAAQIDEEIRAVIDSGYDQCESILTEHMDQLHKVAEFLYEFEKINGADFDRLMKGDFSVFDEYRAKKEQETNQASAGTKPELHEVKAETPAEPLSFPQQEDDQQKAAFKADDK